MNFIQKFFSDLMVKPVKLSIKVLTKPEPFRLEDHLVSGLPAVFTDNMTGKELLKKVLVLAGLNREPHYFGLRYTDRTNGKTLVYLRQQDTIRSAGILADADGYLHLELRMIHFPPIVEELLDDATVEYAYEQTHKDILAKPEMCTNAELKAELDALAAAIAGDGPLDAPISYMMMEYLTLARSLHDYGKEYFEVSNFRRAGQKNLVAFDLSAVYFEEVPAGEKSWKKVVPFSRIRKVDRGGRYVYIHYYGNLKKDDVLVAETEQLAKTIEFLLNTEWKQTIYHEDRKSANGANDQFQQLLVEKMASDAVEQQQKLMTTAATPVPATPETATKVVNENHNEKKH